MLKKNQGWFVTKVEDLFGWEPMSETAIEWENYITITVKNKTTKEIRVVHAPPWLIPISSVERIDDR